MFLLSIFDMIDRIFAAILLSRRDNKSCLIFSASLPLISDIVLDICYVITDVIDNARIFIYHTVSIVPIKAELNKNATH